MTASLNLEDPAVRRLLDGSGARTDVVLPGSDRKMALTQIAGDENHGISSTTYLDRSKHEVALLIRPKNSTTMIGGVVCADIYALPEEPIKVHLICPRCHHTITIDQGKKAIDWRPTEVNPHAAEIRSVLDPDSQWIAKNLGVISVATFQCTWELEDEMQDKGKDDRVIARGSLCRYRCVIERNVLREV